MSDTYSTASPLKNRPTKAEPHRPGGKQLRPNDEATPSGKITSKLPPQPPLHVRHVRIQQQAIKSQSQDTVHSSHLPEPPRRAKSTPMPASTNTPANKHNPPVPSTKHIPPPTSISPSLIPRLHDGHSQLHKPALVKKQASIGSTPQQTDSDIVSKQRLVDRAVRARLYLLRQSGPNRFLIGGDALDSRFHVTIGPQSCTCNKPRCIHLLFVMLRVLKVDQNDPMLWQKQLRNYEAESLLREFQARVSMRTSTPRKASKKKFDFSARKSPDSGKSLVKSASDDQDQPPKPKSDDQQLHTPLSGTLSEPHKPAAGDAQSGDKSEGEEEEEEEEDVCPICLNELDEGEDLLVCDGCHNRLHQHCMDIWAAEQKRKNEDVLCPVCRALWPHATPTISPSQSVVMPVSVPMGEGEFVLGGLRLKSVSPGQHHLSTEKVQLMGRLKTVFGLGAVEGLFSSDWKSRENCLLHLSREAISFLVPLTSRAHPIPSEGAREAQELCMMVVKHTCNDSVLKIFLATLELMRVILGYSVCYTVDEVQQLQLLIKPVLQVLLTRCADAQRRVKDCSIDTVCNLCLGQDGPLSVGSACGHHSLYGVSDLRFVLECALNGGEGVQHSWHWWLGRVNFLDRLISRFTWEYLVQHCVVDPPASVSDSDSEITTTPVGSLTSVSTIASMDPGQVEEDGTELSKRKESPISVEGVLPLAATKYENNLLVQAWYFAARATDVPHQKLGRVARRVIIRVAKVLRDDPMSLEIAHDVVGKCHRTQAEGLLDRVLKVREKPRECKCQDDGHPPEVVEQQATDPRREQLAQPSSPILLQDPETSLVPRRLPLDFSAESDVLDQQLGNFEDKEGEFVPSDESFRSAVSDLEAEAGRERLDSGEGLEASSSTSNSSDSKSGGRRLPKGSTGGENASGTTHPKYYQYKRQSTADSAFSTDFDSSLDSARMGSGYQCKKTIDEEEAEAEAKVRSMIHEEWPHPSLTGLAPPTPEVLIHVQPGEREESDESTDGTAYLEGVQWVKGRLIGTGAFCSCFLARDTSNGTIFAVKQVSYVRNTKSQEEEELKRLREEVAMLGRLGHPNIVRCLGATQYEGHINIFVEWMAGGCLDQLLHDFGPFEESVICNYTRQIIHGIVYLHENGIIHRDLKGGNVLVDSTGQKVRIADFGAAARLATHTTGPGEFQDMEGTVAFMAPEVVRGGTFDDSGAPIGYGRKCDVWSIGCLIIQMATGKPPWVGTYSVSNKYQLIFKIGQATSPPPMPDFNEPALKDLTIRCLEVRPEDRPSSSELLKHPLFTSV